MVFRVYVGILRRGKILLMILGLSFCSFVVRWWRFLVGNWFVLLEIYGNFFVLKLGV